MKLYSLKRMALGAACAGMVVTGSGMAAAQPMDEPSRDTPRCEKKSDRARPECKNPNGGFSNASESSRARQVGSIALPAAAVALGLAIALAASGKGRGPIPVVSP